MTLDLMLGFATAGICSGTFVFVRIVACLLCLHVECVLVAVFCEGLVSFCSFAGWAFGGGLGARQNPI